MSPSASVTAQEPPKAESGAICQRRDCGVTLRPCPWLPGYNEHAEKPKTPHYPRPLRT